MTWEFASKSSSAVHTVTLHPSGELVCTCSGWRFKKPGKPRECTHMTGLIKKNSWSQDVKGDLVIIKEFVENSPNSVAPLLTPPVDDSIIVLVGGTPTMNTTMTTPTQTAPDAQLAVGMTTPVSGAAFNEKYGDGTWSMDEKLDGHRCLVVKRGEDIKCWSRGGAGRASLEKKVTPAILSAIAQMPDGIYDGELMIPGGNSWNVVDLARQHELVVILFDVQEILGQNVCKEPQSMRRDLLAQAVAHVKTDAVRLVASFTPEWAVIEKIWAEGGEGVIVKKNSAPYRPGYRSDAWVKVKQLMSVVGVITGFKAGSFGPHSVTCVTLDSGVKTQVKTLDTVTLAAIEKNPESFLGHRLVIQCQQVVASSGCPRHPMWDHMAGDTE